MNFRRLLLVVLMVGGFGYFLGHYGGDPGMFADRARSAVTLTEAHAAPEYDPAELNNINVYKHAMPTVVNITSTSVGLDFFYGLVPQQGQGSGFILDKAGHILTNFHVIAGAQNIEVQTWDKHRCWLTPGICRSGSRFMPSAIPSASTAP
jgi:S1-C subfamily serine protease